MLKSKQFNKDLKMDFKIYFCADGVLRAQFSEKKPMIPVKFLQDNSVFKDNDFKFWTRWWESNVYFEEGLTVSKFLFCLEPWSDFWSTITGKHVDEYIKEARRPISVKSNDEDDSSLDWVGLFYYTEVEADTEYEKNKEEDELMDRDLNAWFNSPKNVRLSGSWNMHSAYKLTGFSKGIEEQYSVDYTPMNKLANVPFILSDKQWLYFNDWQYKRVLGENKSILNEDSFGICEVGGEHKMKFLIGERHHSMREVVEGFFWWMYATPARREDFVSQLKETKDEIDEMRAEEEKVKDNVIPLFGKDDSTEEFSESTEEKKLKVNVAPGAFDSMINSFNRDKEYWSEMLDLAAKNNNVVLKIGNTQLNKEPENRVFSYIVKPEDAKANPIPTEYKLL